METGGRGRDKPQFADARSRDPPPGELQWREWLKLRKGGQIELVRPALLNPTWYST